MLMKNTAKKTLGECCPIFQTEKWDEKSFHWDKKQFIKSSIPTFFHMPFPPMIGKKVTKMATLAGDADKLNTERLDTLLLFKDPHPFKSEMYLSVTDEVPEAKNTTLSGSFVAKVFDGPYKDIPKFFKKMNAFLAQQGKKAKDYFVYYAYCPQCAKEAGHNYMVIFAQIEE